jgi:hypothetical protein
MEVAIASAMIHRQARNVIPQQLEMAIEVMRELNFSTMTTMIFYFKTFKSFFPSSGTIVCRHDRIGDGIITLAKKRKFARKLSEGATVLCRDITVPCKDSMAPCTDIMTPCKDIIQTSGKPLLTP